MSGLIKVGDTYVNLSQVRHIDTGTDRETLFLYFDRGTEAHDAASSLGVVLQVSGKAARALRYYLDMLSYDVIGGPL